MLKQILLEIKSAKEPVSLPALSRKLGIDRSALEGMLMYWVQKGRLSEDTTQGLEPCHTGVCGSSCTGPESCPFIAQMPKTYSIKK